MDAYFSLEMTLIGDRIDIKKMLEVLVNYSNYGDREVCFTGIELNGRDEHPGPGRIDLKNITDELVSELLSSGKVEVRATGPFGYYVELNDVDLFREMAEVAPNARFDAEISGSQQYSVQNLNCRLDEGKLYITTFFQFNSEAGDAWKADFKKKLPLEKFKELFAVSGDFNEKSYAGALNDFECDFRDGLEYVAFDDFVFTIEHNNGITELDEERFKKIMKCELPALGICDPVEFEDGYEGGTTNEYIFDPIAKAYVGRTKPLFAGTGVIDDAYAALGAALSAEDGDGLLDT